jgi:arylamine N-acetyltransferase
MQTRQVDHHGEDWEHVHAVDQWKNFTLCHHTNSKTEQAYEQSPIQSIVQLSPDSPGGRYSNEKQNYEHAGQNAPAIKKEVYKCIVSMSGLNESSRVPKIARDYSVATSAEQE